MPTELRADHPQLRDRQRRQKSRAEKPRRLRWYFRPGHRHRMCHVSVTLRVRLDMQQLSIAIFAQPCLGPAQVSQHQTPVDFFFLVPGQVGAAEQPCQDGAYPVRQVQGAERVDLTTACWFYYSPPRRNLNHMTATRSRHVSYFQMSLTDALHL